ncbi:Cytochrome [Dirofilaria immitis]
MDIHFFKMLIGRRWDASASVYANSIPVLDLFPALGIVSCTVVKEPLKLTFVNCGTAALLRNDRVMESINHRWLIRYISTTTVDVCAQREMACAAQIRSYPLLRPEESSIRDIESDMEDFPLSDR